MDFGPPVSIKEGAAEVKAKLKSDISRWTRFRGAVSIKPLVACKECFGKGRVECISCDGTGKSKVVLNDAPENCHTCGGQGTVTCTECSGRGLVPNVHRKKILWLIGIGGAAWLFVLWSLLGRDVAPESIAKLKGGGGRSTGAPVPLGTRAPAAVPGGRGATVIMPGGGTGVTPRGMGMPGRTMPGGYGAVGGGYSAVGRPPSPMGR